MSDPIRAKRKQCIVDDDGNVWQIIEDSVAFGDPWPIEMVHDNPWPGLYYPQKGTFEPDEGEVIKVEDGTETDIYIVVNGCWEYK